MQEICPKMNAEVFERRNAEETTYGACDGPSCSWWSVGGSVVQLLKEDGGSKTKCGVTESVMDRRVHDSPSCRFVMKFREVVPVPIFQEFKFFGMETLDGPLCLWRSVIPAVERNEESKRTNCNKYGTTESITVRRDHDDPSRCPSIQLRFDRFPANRVLM